MMLFVLLLFTLTTIGWEIYISTFRIRIKQLYNKVNQSLFLRVFRTSSTNYKLFGFFILTCFRAILGLIPYSHHLILSWLCCTFLIIVTFLWMLRYHPFTTSRRGFSKLVRMLVIDIKIPLLSLLMTHIEIITHLFRPITLFGRIWVNLWVGHLLLRVSTFANSLTISKVALGRILRTPILSAILLLGLFLYEVAVSFLQSLVLIYLVRLYYKENVEGGS